MNYEKTNKKKFELFYRTDFQDLCDFSLEYLMAKEPATFQEVNSLAVALW